MLSFFSVVASGGSKAFDVTETLSSTYNKLELRNHLLARGWDGEAPLTGTITLSGYCYSDDINAYGLYIRNLSADSDITLVITATGSVRGKGGQASAVTTLHGERGGNALYAYNHNGSIIRIQNNGWIGGGGGGGGSSFQNNQYGAPFLRAGGGGGAGTTPGIGAEGTGASGQNGTETSGGARGYISSENRGGRGGDRGEGGQAGDSDDLTSGQHTQGGAGGNSVVGNNRITWINVGTLYGARVNN